MLDAASLNQLQPSCWHAVQVDDGVIEHGDAERAGDVDNRLRHLDVRLRQRRGVQWVIVTARL
jgi:hypothetical protein